MSGHTLAMRLTVFSSASTKERSTGGLFIFVVHGLNGKFKFACLCRDTVNLAVGLEHQTIRQRTICNAEGHAAMQAVRLDTNSYLMDSSCRTFHNIILILKPCKKLEMILLILSSVTFPALLSFS